MTKFRKSILILGLLVLLVAAALGTFIVLSLTGSLKTEAIALEFTVEDAMKEYDGKPLMASGYSITSGYLIEGHESVVNFKGEQTDVGYGYSSLDVKIVNEAGLDVTKEYDITVIGGILQVNKCPVQVNVTTEEVTYDGNKIDIGDNYTVSGRQLAKGNSVRLKIKDNWFSTVGYTVAGETLTEEYLEPIVVDANGRDVTANYQINIKSQVKILPRPITISPINAQKYYDGTALKCTQYKIDSGSLVSGHYVEPLYARTSGSGDPSVTNVNTDNPLAIHARISQIYDLDGNRVTANYTINSNIGYLTVNKAPLTLRLSPVTVEYGDPIEEEFKNDSFYDIASTVNNLKLQFNDSNYIKNLFKDITGVVNTTYTISDFILFSGSNDVTAMFDINVVPGQLTVKKRKVEFEELALSKPYDGNLVFTDMLPALDNLVENHKLDSITCISDNGKISAESNYSVKSVSIIDAQGNSVSGYYNITNFDEVSVELEKRAISITSNSYTKVYDGTALSGGDLKYNSIAAGDRLVYTPFEITFVDESGDEGADNIPEELTIINSNGEEVTDLYATPDYSGCGKLKILPCKLSVEIMTITCSDIDSIYNQDDPTKLVKISNLADGDEILYLDEKGAKVEDFFECYYFYEYGSGLNEDIVIQVWNGEKNVSKNYIIPKWDEITGIVNVIK